MEKALAELLAGPAIANADERTIAILEPFGSHANVRRVLSKLHTAWFPLSAAEADRCAKLEALLPAPAREPIVDGAFARRHVAFAMAQPHARIETLSLLWADAPAEILAMPVFRHVREAAAPRDRACRHPR
jgi:hypothetical protein